MNRQRDLIILTKLFISDMDEIEKQVRSLNILLHHVENLDVFCIANEIIDINRYKIIDAPRLVRKIITEKAKPFVFQMNKN